MLTHKEIAVALEKLCQATNGFHNESLEVLWAEKFSKKDPKLFKKLIDHLCEFDHFPKIAEALAYYRMLARGMGKGQIEANYFQKSCAWCESGKVYFIRLYNAKNNKKGYWEYIGACAICYPAGNQHLDPINPSDYMNLAKRALSDGGPVIIDPEHISRFSLKSKGIDPDEIIYGELPDISEFN